MFRKFWGLATLSLLLLGHSLGGHAALPAPSLESDVASTNHNFSVTSPGTVKATSETQICVFCHTPHGATSGATPLWNRTLAPDANYTGKLYSSESMDASIDTPTGNSKLCLSCHDGTIAIGAVNVINGTQPVSPVTGLDVTMPAGTDGYTRNLGTDLTNDHPISFTYDDTLAGNDGELYAPSTTPAGARIAVRSNIPAELGESNPEVPLQYVDASNTSEMQCTSCHDPHVWDKSGSQNIKFLRLNRFQVTNTPSDGTFTKSKDIICLACHDKEGWAGSIHANSTKVYDSGVGSAAETRDFPDNIEVWEAACLNCHDTHTAAGANRLQRGGVVGGVAASEETCYQCHDGTTNVLTTTVANIKSDFTTLATHMPITDADQGSTEGTAHAIGTGTDGDEGTQRGKDFIEDQANLAQRHAECTDCHNPHRVMRNTHFDKAGPGNLTSQGTHLHDSGTMHTNEASGVLTGTWGVEPKYTNGNCGTAANWSTCDLPATDYDIRRGTYNKPGSNGAVNAEYQICLKCHSSYSYGANPPNLSLTGGGTPSGTNGVTQYTDQAFELQGNGALEGSATHTGFHPIRTPTLRTAANRGLNAAAANQPFLAPWNDSSGTNIGNQTMYCSDCHGSNVTSTTSVVPDTGNPWGPHGSSNDFILKGSWDVTSGSATTDAICFKCHEYDQYGGTGGAAVKTSGFRGTGTGCAMGNIGTNLHVAHSSTIGSMRCTWCHVAVPHGWQNKALLVNMLNDKVPGSATALMKDVPTTPCTGTDIGGCTAEPYYLGAQLGGGGAVNWQTSGNWTSGDCGQNNGSWMWAGGGAGAGAGAGAGGGGCPY